MVSKALARRICVTFSVLLSSANSYPTSVVIVSDPHGNLFVGADGLVSGEINGKLVAYSTCKIQQFGATFVTQSGGILQVVAPNGTSPHATTFAVEPLIKNAATLPGTLDGKADSFDAQYWPRYEILVPSIFSMNASPSRDVAVGSWTNNRFAFMGIGKSGRPRAIILGYTNDFTKSPNPTKFRAEIPRDHPGVFFGWSEKSGIFNHIHEDAIIDTIRKYLALETSLHPTQVGPPFTIIKISGDGLHVIEAGACRYRGAQTDKAGGSQAKKQIPQK